MEYELVPLHENKHHTDDCVAILNTEWPRSKAAREHSLNRSCDGLPCSLVFRRVDNKQVIGYSLVTKVQGKGQACLFESVIIEPDLRGKGLGRALMQATEQFAKGKNFQTAYLNTIDKQGFYSHLGYTQCGPVTCLGANASRVSDQFLQKLLGTEMTDSINSVTTDSHGSENNNNATRQASATAQPSSAPPPPPSAAPSGPPPPPPPPPPSQAPASSKAGLSRHVIRMDPNALTWMHKSLQ